MPHQRPFDFTSRAVIPLLLFVLVASLPSKANADALGRLLKRTAGVADDVPLNKTDDALSRLRMLPIVRPTDEAMQAVGEAALKNPDDLRAAAVLVDGCNRQPAGQQARLVGV